ncbi:MAG TPA: DUF4166 domain-containing protein [Steroidobacteraceae bacterium]|nr:DUF4166 domain-containing protein [Steroidobacteraceae bacterium]
MTQAARALPQALVQERQASGVRHGLRAVLGPAAWNRLPEAVRERFADCAGATTYAGSFEVVRASWLGLAFAWLGRLFGTPVTPHTGAHVASRVLVRPDLGGVSWDREYHWPDGSRDLVRSTKVVSADGRLTERLPARMCMPLDTYVEGAVLHFVSLGYYFDLGFGLKLWLPRLLSPGVTHVEHIDLDHGWFRFTMTVMHPLWGELFFQTGRFCATEEAS